TLLDYIAPPNVGPGNGPRSCTAGPQCRVQLAGRGGFAMPDLPLPSQTDVTIQNQSNGQVDYLKYEGNVLVGSSLFDYGLGSDFKIVASTFNTSSGNIELVAQSVSTGRVDFLTLNDLTGQLLSSAMSSVGVPRIVGLSAGIGSLGGNEFGTFASQLPDGELDF